MIINQIGNFNILACGINRQTKETLAMLAEWADKILLAEQGMINHFPEEYHNKIDKVFELGSDIWGNPFNPDLHTKIKEELKKINFI